MEEATRRFQAMYGLEVTGRVVADTWEKALEFGLLNDGFPYPTRGLAAISSVERPQVFGAFTYKATPQPNNPEAIKLDNQWIAKNLSWVRIPQIAGLPGALDGRVMVHNKVADKILSFFDAVEGAGLKDRLLTWGGSFAPRFIRGSTSILSNHSFGSAFDINVAWNGLNTRGVPIGAKGSVFELVHLAEEHGFFWGGWFQGRPDPMHFEYALRD